MSEVVDATETGEGGLQSTVSDQELHEAIDVLIADIANHATMFEAYNIEMPRDTIVLVAVADREDSYYDFDFPKRKIESLKELCEDTEYAEVGAPVKIQFKAAAEYLKGTFVNHHITAESFKKESHFKTYTALAKHLFKNYDGEWMTPWNAFDVLLVARLLSEEWSREKDKSSDKLLDRAGKELPTEALKRIHLKVTEHVLIPKIEKAGTDCLAFFDGARLQELGCIKLFADKHETAIRDGCQKDVKRYIKALLNRLDRINRLYENYIVVSGPADELEGDEFVFLPPGIEKLWQEIDYACCHSRHYNVKSLAPYLYQSLRPSGRAEAIRPRPMF